MSGEIDLERLERQVEKAKISVRRSQTKVEDLVAAACEILGFKQKGTQLGTCIFTPRNSREIPKCPLPAGYASNN